MILTRNTGVIMGPVTWLLGKIFNAIYILFNGMGVESIALSIVVFTIITRFSSIFSLSIIRLIRNTKVRKIMNLLWLSRGKLVSFSKNMELR